MDMQTLNAKARDKALAVKTLIEADKPDMAQVKALQDEADALLAQAAAIQKADATIKSVGEPQRHVALPTGVEPEPQPKEWQGKMLYQLQFGTEDAAVKAILCDLHGANYEQKRYEQAQGFTRYLRTGKGISEHGEFLWTPATIKVALAEGQDVKAMKTVMVEAVDTLGGYVVPADFQASVISRMAAMTVVRPRATRIQTSRDSVEIPVATGGSAGVYRDAVRVTWVDEAPTAGAGATNLTFGLEKVPVHTVMAETFLSRNLVEDAAFDIIGWLTESFASAQAIDEDNQFLCGDGNGRPQGILPSGSIDVLTSAQQVVSGNASALTWGGLISATFGLDAMYRQNAVWIGEKATYEDIAGLTDGSGQYLWREVYGNNVTAGGAGTVRGLLGYPVLEQEAMPSVGSNTFPLLFGDLRGYTIVDRVGMSVERYLDSSTARINQVVYIARRRLGGQCTQPWRFVAQKCST